MRVDQETAFCLYRRAQKFLALPLDEGIEPNDYGEGEATEAERLVADLAVALSAAVPHGEPEPSDIAQVRALIDAQCNCLDSSDWELIDRVALTAMEAMILLRMVRRNGPTTLFCMEADALLSRSPTAPSDQLPGDDRDAAAP